MRFGLLLGLGIVLLFSSSVHEAESAPKPIAESKSIKDRKTPPSNTPVYSWTPCEEYIGNYFPHPVKCNMFYQCTNGHSVEQACIKGLLYHWKSMTCVSRYMPNVKCPDPKAAPPRPTTRAPTTPTPKTISTTTAAMTTTLGSTIDLFLQDELYTDTTYPTTGAIQKPAPVSRQLSLPPGMKLTEIAGRAKGSYDVIRFL